MGDFSIFKICGWAIHAGGWAFAHLGNMLKVALHYSLLLSKVYTVLLYLIP